MYLQIELWVIATAFIIDIKQQKATWECHIYECVNTDEGFEITHTYPYQSSSHQQAVIDGFALLAEKVPPIENGQFIGSHKLFKIQIDETDWQIFAIDHNIKIEDQALDNCIAHGTAENAQAMQQAIFGAVAGYIWKHQYWRVLFDD